MKILYMLLVAVMLFAFAGLAQAQEDPYSGSYSCSGEPQHGCGSGECSDLDIYPPYAVNITKVSGNIYQFCPQFDSSKPGIMGNNECLTFPIEDGHAHWSGTSSCSDLTFTGEATIDFSGNSFTAVESGQASGICECALRLEAVCTK